MDVLFGEGELWHKDAPESERHRKEPNPNEDRTKPNPTIAGEGSSFSPIGLGSSPRERANVGHTGLRSPVDVGTR